MVTCDDYHHVNRAWTVSRKVGSKAVTGQEIVASDLEPVSCIVQLTPPTLEVDRYPDLVVHNDQLELILLVTKPGAHPPKLEGDPHPLAVVDEHDEDDCPQNDL